MKVGHRSLVFFQATVKSGPQAREPDLPADPPGIQGAQGKARKATP